MDIGQRARNRASRLGVVGLSHSTSSYEALDILKKGYIMTPPMAEAMGCPFDGTCYDETWRDFYQYPGVYMAPMVATDLGTDSWGYLAPGRDVRFVFSIALLAQENFHYNPYDDWGYFSCDSLKASDLDRYSGRPRTWHRNNDEFVFHDSVSLVFCEAIYVNPKEKFYMERMRAAAPAHIPVIASFVSSDSPYDKFCDDSRAMARLLDKRSPMFLSVPNARTCKKPTFVHDTTSVPVLQSIAQSENIPEPVLRELRGKHTLEDFSRCIYGENCHGVSYPEKLIIDRLKTTPMTFEHDIEPSPGKPLEQYVNVNYKEGAHDIRYEKLIIAAYMNDLDEVKKLVSSGMSLEPARGQASAMGIAAFMDNYKVVRHLLRHGAVITNQVMRYARDVTTLTYEMLVMNRSLWPSDRVLSLSTSSRRSKYR